ncbi:MAG TPA: hypothetical protein VK595_14165 [Vicinamibacterales bacterium]|nr:hypothetical protein [Vicinamibacterales bacterium]
MAETIRQVRLRLQDRTLELQKEHDALEHLGRRFDKAEHERHRDALLRHHQELDAYRELPDWD